MKVAQVKCPRCGKASFSKLKDSVIFCEECRTLHTISDAGPMVVDYEIGDFGRELPLRKFHMPFWRLFSQVTVFSANVVGGWAGRLLASGSGGGNLNGTMFIFVPGMDMQPDIYKRMAQDFTTNPPQYRSAERFGFERLPVTVDELAARKLADFLVLSFEAEKPGVLQDIKYQVEVQRTKLVYLPFYQDAEGRWQPGL